MTNVGHLSPNLPSKFGGLAPAPAINKSLIHNPSSKLNNQPLASIISPPNATLCCNKYTKYRIRSDDIYY